MARSACLSKHPVGAINQRGEAFIIIIIIIIIIDKHALNRSWTHNFTLHLELVKAWGASWQKV